MIADWGNKRTYIVDHVAFDMNPMTHTFVYNGENISLADYFHQVYKKEILCAKQPLLAVKNAGNVLYLPTEFCLIDGVPTQMKKSNEMRNALAETRLRPVEKMSKIRSMVTELF